MAPPCPTPPAGQSPVVASMPAPTQSPPLQKIPHSTTPPALPAKNHLPPAKMMADIHPASADQTRPHRLAVRTPPFHGSNRGSIPRGVAFFLFVAEHQRLRPLRSAVLILQMRSPVSISSPRFGEGRCVSQRFDRLHLLGFFPGCIDSRANRSVSACICRFDLVESSRFLHPTPQRS
jgi:hypothetical protein